MDALMIVAAAVLALVAGVVIGWVLGGRSAKPLKSAADAAKVEADTLRERCGAVERELAVASEQARRLPQTEETLRLVTEERNAAHQQVASLAPIAERAQRQETELAALRAEKEQLAAAKAAFERGEQERRRAFEEQLAQVKDLEAKLEKRFGELAGKAVESAHDAFLKRASERLGNDSKEHSAKLQTLLQPVEATLKRYEEGLQRVEKEREGSYRELQQAVSQLAHGNDQVRKETQRLANVMGSSPKARGRWGEEQLRNILESAGLSENVDFSLQSTVSDGERNLRPDCVITLPGDRTIVIDVKCPLVAFEQAFDEEDDTRRSELLRQHSNALKSYASELGKKGYWRQFEKSPDFVIMFVPGEHFLSAAAERAPDLIETAFRNGVIIASTINMLALAKIMAGMWRQESLNAQAQELGRVGRELHGRLATLGGHVAKLGRNLEQANGNFNAMVGSLESQVMTSARRFEELGAGSGKAIEPLPMVEATPRPLTKLAAPILDEPPQIAAE